LTSSVNAFASDFIGFGFSLTFNGGYLGIGSNASSGIIAADEAISDGVHR
jgi:hypothetical protein